MVHFPSQILYWKRAGEQAKFSIQKKTITQDNFREQKTKKNKISAQLKSLTMVVDLEP